jgi:diguanylate cyclase
MDKSAEYQHCALQMMARHTANPHPICYAVWYEYATGINPALNEAIDARKAQGEVFGDDTICMLYRQHVAGNTDGGSLMGHLDESRREIDKLRREILQAREDALTDKLSGLLNRRGFELAFQDGISAHCRKVPPNPCLLLADVDHFKKINDGYGHTFGDCVIRTVAKILRDNLKGKDVAARYGGEEFIVLLPDTPLKGAHFLAEKIRATVAQTCFHRADERKTDACVTISIGVARYRHGETPLNLIERADVALYAAKASGRNRVMVAEPLASD